MTTQAIEKEEDLIILSDETSSDTSILDFDFDTKSDINSNNESIIDFSDNTEKEVSIDFSLDDSNLFQAKEEISLPEIKEEISFGDDLFGSSVVAASPAPALSEEVVDIVSSNVDFGFGEVKETSANEVISEITSQVENTFITETELFSTEEQIVATTSFDRNTILDEAISKMKSRKGIIGQTQSTKQSKVDELNEQIKALKFQVSQLESEIKDLAKEDSALDLDISSIEKMKLSVLEISSDRARKHNLDTIKKK